MMARSTRKASARKAPVSSDPLVAERTFGIDADVFVPGVSIPEGDDDTLSILAFLAVGEDTPTFTHTEPKAPKVRNGSKAAKRSSRKGANARKRTTARASAPSETKVPVVGSVLVADKPKGRSKPSAKQTVRVRWEITFTDPSGQKFTVKRRFRFFRKAERHADSLRNRGHNVTITPIRTAFTRKPKAAPKAS